jgi:hypothetical protein
MNTLTPILNLCMALVVAGVPMYIQGMVLELDASSDIRKRPLSKKVKAAAIGLMAGGAGIILVIFFTMLGITIKLWLSRP